MKENIHHLGQEKQKKSNFLQLKSYKISGGTIGKIDPDYGLNSSGRTPQQAFNARKAAEAEKAKAEAEAAQIPIVQNEKIVAAVANVLNNSTKKTNNIQIANAVVNIAQVVAANVAVNKPTTKNNNNNNIKKYIELLTKIRNGITNILPKE